MWKGREIQRITIKKTEKGKGNKKLKHKKREKG
jgi:hypothetical protein